MWVSGTEWIELKMKVNMLEGELDNLSELLGIKPPFKGAWEVSENVTAIILLERALEVLKDVIKNMR